MLRALTKCGTINNPLLLSSSSAISVELYYIFATLWGREQYTLFGILFIVYGILLSVTACISVALTYFQLSAEDYRWWWRSIFSAGSVLFLRGSVAIRAGPILVGGDVV